MTFTEKVWYDRPNQPISFLAKDLNRIEKGILERPIIDDVSRIVCRTAFGGNGTEDGAGTWAKIVTVSTKTNTYVDTQLILGVAGSAYQSSDTAIISALFRANAANTNPTVDVRIIAKGGVGVQLSEDSFKIISGGWSSDMELWIRKDVEFGGFTIYQLAKSIIPGLSDAAAAVTYTTDPQWQSAAPTGTVNNIFSNGVTAFGSKVLTEANTPAQKLLAPSSYVSGQYYFANSASGVVTSSTLGNGNVRVSAWLVSNKITISRLFCEYTAPGDVGSKFRIGIWNDDGTGKPGELFLDAGTVATDVAISGNNGVVEITGLSEVVPPGLYWIGGAVQNVTTTQPTMRICGTNNILFPQGPLGSTLPGAGMTLIGYAASGQTGSFADLSSPNTGGSAVRIGFKVA